MSLLEIDNLHVDFATSSGTLHAVRGASLEMGEGEIVGIVGESGSGKSVTASSVLRLLPANGVYAGGDIRYRGRSVFSLSPTELREFRGAEVSMIFQEPGRSFDPIYSVGRAMAETITAHKPNLSEQEVHRRSVELLDEVNVPYPEQRMVNFPHQFSGGLLQRIMIALALASDPKVLIADEPTTALDVTIQAGIMDLLLRLRKERNLGILFITHNLALISKIADRIVVMYGGMVLESGLTRDVLHAPHHPYTRALLNSILSFGRHYTTDQLQIIPGTVPNPYFPEPGCPFAPRCPLVHEPCTSAVPPVVDDGHRHRCLLSGVKE